MCIESCDIGYGHFPAGSTRQKKAPGSPRKETRAVAGAAPQSPSKGKGKANAEPQGISGVSGRKADGRTRQASKADRQVLDHVEIVSVPAKKVSSFQWRSYSNDFLLTTLSREKAKQRARPRLRRRAPQGRPCSRRFRMKWSVQRMRKSTTAATVRRTSGMTTAERQM